MIEWSRAIGILEEMIDSGEGGLKKFNEAVDKSPKFRNKDFNFIANPLVISGDGCKGLKQSVESYVAILEKLIRLYCTERPIRDFYGFSPRVESLIEASYTALHPEHIHICRLDGYIGPETGSLVVLENNSDCPAGTLFTGRLNKLVGELVELGVQGGHDLVQMEMDKSPAFLDALLREYRRFHSSTEKPGMIAVLQLSGRTNVESEEMALEFTERGYPTMVVDPREIQFQEEGLFVHGHKLDLIWNKINTVYWQSVADENPKIYSDWAAAISARKICHLNPFTARYITENKLTLALLRDEQFRHLFLDQEWALLQSLLPWATKLELGKRVRFEDIEHDLHWLLLEKQNQFVVKQQYDIRGDGVTIGRSVGRAAWEEAVDAGFQNGSIVQQFTKPSGFPVLMGKGSMKISIMNVSLDSFVFGGVLKGFGAKASHLDKVNLFQGGSKISVKVAG